jgi:hypothetical protein
MTLAGTKVRIQRPGNAQTLKHFVLRFRGAGHLRFDIPKDIAADQRGERLRRALLELDGVYRVLLFSAAGKLSIRYDMAALEERQVVKHLAAVVSALPAQAPPDETLPSTTKVAQNLLAHPLVRWGGDKFQQSQRTVQTVVQRMASKTGSAKPLPFDAKEWGVHFINDLVAFYLIRVHWTRITQQWLPNPWAFRYQWMTIIYLTFVLVRYRKASLKKSAAK